MTTVTSQEIALFRSQLADDSEAMEALDLIEDCDGDLEDAAMTLAIRAGQEPGMTNSEWLDAMARKWRAVICEQEYREDLLSNSLGGIMERLKTMPTFPQILATPVLIYILKQGVKDFCEPMDALQ
ncbi:MULTISPECIES: hypothetical protein [unclassified Nodularia (in: cyanobacteria)]|uniref:hypothetical protein n=1 Tax=unclassified Nodularia (in: cyanobacteria) TaxID=2656917 RepID=UPI00187F23D0|nr:MULTISPECIES: hypothetical protein [unclassified Nodularia (in: cyanobacteria)]MBE9200578.1 hypothetical protein [Nodularia sp. LEGE 06071]MCC2692518.1 hypothetical protein [Nodularia sp. LEGE 04288]